MLFIEGILFIMSGNNEVSDGEVVGTGDQSPANPEQQRVFFF